MTIVTELDQLIANAFASQGNQDDANKVYTAFLRTQLFIPIRKDPDGHVAIASDTDEEPFVPLFAQFEDKIFMLVFDSAERLETWAGDERGNMAYVQITGSALVRGIGNEVYLGLNIGTTYYKEFVPEEIQRLKTIVAKLDSWRPLT